MTHLTARLHPKWVGRRDGYRYSVIFEGKLIVDRSTDERLLSVASGAVCKTLERWGQEAVLLFLNTPLEACLSL